MLRNNYKMPNASGCYPVAKSHQDVQGLQSEQLRTLVVELLSQAVSIACILTHGCVTML